jgi:hypothetical protein
MRWVWWVYALWRVVSGRGRRILRPTFGGDPVSERWLRQQTYRDGQSGIDGPVWPWPLTKTRAHTAVASRSSHHVGRSDEV